MLRVSDEILNEYQEILERHTTAEIAENVILSCVRTHTFSDCKSNQVG